MNDTPSTSIECGTCVAAGTTACTDCIVTHLLANDDGPVDFVPVTLRAAVQSPVDRAIDLFRRAGLLDDPAEFVPLEEFERPTHRVEAIVSHGR